MERYYLGLSRCIAAVAIIFMTCVTAVFNVKKSRTALKKLENMSDVALVLTPLLLTYSTFAIMNGFVHTWVQDDTFLHFGGIIRQWSAFLATNWITAIIVSFCAVGHVPFRFFSASFRKRLSTKSFMLNLSSYLFALVVTVLCCCLSPSLTEGMIDIVNISSKPDMWSLLYGCVCILQFCGSGNESTNNLRNKRYNCRPTNIKKYIAKSEYIQKFCINEKRGEGSHLFFWTHHLPLKDTAAFAMDEENWDLPQDVVETISRYAKELGEYAEKTESRIKESDIPEFKEVLPPWIVFPLYPVNTIGWRMGIGEGYMMAFSKFLESLSKEELEEYKNLYPEPEYFKSSF